LKLLKTVPSDGPRVRPRSGTTFTFPVSDGKLTDKYAVAPDLSENYPSPINIDDHAALENLAAVARTGQVFTCRPGHRRSLRCCRLPEVIKAYRLKMTPPPPSSGGP
jgi:hypothetical protein